MSARCSHVSLLTSALAAALAIAIASDTRVETHPRITTTLLWTKDIAPILQRRCYSCHSPSNVAFSLTTYAEARPWAAAIREEILTRHMPLWTATAGYGRFQNDPTLTQGEWDLIVAWADGGAPSGQTLDEEQTPPVFAATSATWERGEPDLVLKAAVEHTVKAGASSEVRRVEIETAFKTPQRVHGLAFKPTDRRVVRYATISEAESGRWLFTWTPWFTTFHLPEGMAYALPAGARLTVEIGYRGADEAVVDQSEIGLYLDDSSASGTAVVQSARLPGLDLAPGAAPTRTRGELVLPESAAIQAIWPEPGPGVTSVEVTAFLPDGVVRPLLWLRGHHDDWPSPYIYTDPVPLPRGTRVVMTVHAANTGDAPQRVEPRLTVVRVPTSATTF